MNSLPSSNARNKELLLVANIKTAYWRNDGKYRGFLQQMADVYPSARRLTGNQHRAGMYYSSPFVP